MTVDASGYLPPHELRALGANLVDHVDPAAGHPPGLDLATTSSPGLATAAAAPTGLAPTLPAEEPGALAIGIARLAGELFGAPVVPAPVPVPDHVASGLGLAAPASPGIAPELAAADAAQGSPGIAPELAPLGLVPSDALGSPGIAPELAAAGAAPGSPGIAPELAAAGAAPGSPGIAAAGAAPADAPGAPEPVAPVALLHSQPPGGELRIPFAPNSELVGAAGLPVLGATGAPLSPTIDPRAGAGTVSPLAAIPQLPSAFDVPGVAIDRVPLHGGEAPATRTGSAVRPSAGDAFDPHAVRRDFPILQERVHGGKRLVWLDNAATTQKPHAVIDRLTYFYEHENSNVHRAAHVLAARATDAYEGARDTTRKFLNAPSASEIVFVRGATEGINLIAKAWGARHVERGDEIVVTHLEHHANIVPWQQLCAQTGARLRVAPVDDRGDVILEAYEQLLCSRTRLVAFTQVSNALGTVTPAREMIEIAHRWGATVVLDGAQAVSHMAVDVQALDCDFYVFSGHKVFAPTGIGAVFGKRALLDAMPPWQGGGNMIADVTFERTLYQAPPWRFEAGTGNIADAAGLGAALDYVLGIGMPTIERYEHELLGYATERLATVPGLRMIGTPRHKAGVLSFVLDGRRTEDVGAALDRDGIAVRSGHHCAQPILRRYGLESTVRASLAFYNVHEDIDALVGSLKRIQATSV